MHMCRSTRLQEAWLALNRYTRKLLMPNCRRLNVQCELPGEMNMWPQANHYSKEAKVLRELASQVIHASLGAFCFVQLVLRRMYKDLERGSSNFLNDVVNKRASSGKV